MKEYRSEINRFRKDFNDKATKKEFTKLNELIVDSEAAFDAKYNHL